MLLRSNFTATIIVPASIPGIFTQLLDVEYVVSQLTSRAEGSRERRKMDVQEQEQRPRDQRIRNAQRDNKD